MWRHRVMDFGKHKGSKLPEVPTPYLRWLLREVNLEEPFRADVEAALAARRSGSQAGTPMATSNPTVEIGPVVTRWYRQLCLDFHPDRGGSEVAMQTINEAYARLKKMLAELPSPRQ